MEKEMMRSIIYLTRSNNMISYDKLGKYVAETCSKKNGGKFYSSDINVYEISEGEYQGNIYKGGKEYCIFKKHIEEKDRNGLPFLVEFYEIDKYDEKDNLIETFYMI